MNSQIPSSVSVLIPSWRRPDRLVICLNSLAAQTRLPDQVIVVWQADDTATRDAAEGLTSQLPYRLDVLHSPEAGVVVAENLALDAAVGEIIAMIDDDAIPAPDWLARHLAFYADPKVGAVGGPCDAYFQDGTPLPKRAVEPVGIWTKWGGVTGNMYDHVPEWRTRPPREVDHLVGYNMSLRRAAFHRFETGLRRYWQYFEMDACLQVRGNGYRVMFDFGNVVEHHPTNTAYTGGRHGDLTVKVVNPSFNLGFVIGKYLPMWRWPVIAARQLLIGRVTSPGIVASMVAIRRHGGPLREAGLLVRTMKAYLSGLFAGRKAHLSKIESRDHL